MPPLPVVKILKKNWGHRENLGESGFKLLRDLTEKSVHFCTFGNFQYQVFASFVEEDQQTKLIRLVRKKLMITEEKLGKITTL